MSPAARWLLLLVLAGLGGIAAGHPCAMGAETASPSSTSKTVIMLKLDASEPLTVSSTFRDHPPTIIIEFPGQRVVGSLPERSTIAKGVIQSISARYERGASAPGKRLLQSIRITLSGPYRHRIRSEPGAILVEINHPASVGSAAVEVGLRRGLVIEGLARHPLSERFQAMQEALARAAPSPWVAQPTPAGDSPEAGGRMSEAQDTGERHLVVPSSLAGPGRRPDGRSASGNHAGIAGALRSSLEGLQRGSRFPLFLWGLVALGVVVTAVSGLWWLSTQTRPVRRRRSAMRASSARMPAGLQFMDQLVWQAFEQQGYQLVSETPDAHPMAGTLRVVSKDGQRAAFLLLGHGPFLEQQAVERFLHVMQGADVERGVLVAAGSFTVPAHRFAKAHGISLIEREQLAGLLSTGASVESMAREVEEQRGRVRDTMHTLQQYADELEALRRQRNEATWQLGEERAKTTTLEAQVVELSRAVQQHEADLHRWEEEASVLRRQWEESQWYLGEAQARGKHLEAQLTPLQEIAGRADVAEREGNEAKWYLGEECAKREALEQEVGSLQKSLEMAVNRECALRDALEQFRREVAAIQTYGERRSSARGRIPQAIAELCGEGSDPVVIGSLRDMSRTGIGLDTDRELPQEAALKVRVSAAGCEAIESTAEVVWQRSDDQNTRWQCGLRFRELSDDARASIDRLTGSSIL